jgi:hypothetical protein
MTDADRELVERVARGMGWVRRGDDEWVSPDGRWMEWVTLRDRWGDERSVRVGWDPLTDANADLQVLAAAKDKWHLAYTGNDREPWAVFCRALSRGEWYQCGDYARAFDTVLTSTAGANR